MLVSDIFQDAKDYLGIASETAIFSIMTDAVEVLANKGQWEPLMAYMTANVAQTGIVILPDSVEVPLRVSIATADGGHPAFSLDKGYEFTMNGPGPLDTRLGWSWEDRGTQAHDGARIIKINANGASVATIRALVRLKTSKITAMNQWIPLHSKMAILLMMKALQSYKRGTTEEMQIGAALEAQAEKFITEEQKSRDIFKEVAQQIDKPPIIGFDYHTADMVRVADIYDEASEILGGVGKQTVIDSITEAVRILSTKGPWDSQLAFLDILVSASGIVTLPREVESPLRINVDNHPAFTRTKLYEFSINGPGKNLSETTTFQWLDNGYSPIIGDLNASSGSDTQGRPPPRPPPGQRPPPPPPPRDSLPTQSDEDEVTSFSTSTGYKLKALGSVGADNGKHLTVYGHGAHGVEVSEQLTISNLSTTGSTVRFVNITRVSKDETVGTVKLLKLNGDILSSYYPDETEPMYRQIKVKPGVNAIKILFKRSAKKLTSYYDFIPLKSKTAVLLQLRALQAYKGASLDANALAAAASLSEQAMQFLKDDQACQDQAAALTANERAPALGINYHNADSIVMSDVYDDAADIFGQIGRSRIFDKTTDALELLNNKGQWDGLEGYVDLFVDNERYITLPRRVEVPLQINTSCGYDGSDPNILPYASPAEMQNSYFQFHLNGPGTSEIPISFYRDEKDAVVVRQPATAQRLYANCDYLEDEGVNLIVHGYDVAGKRVMRPDPTNTARLLDGVVIPVRVMNVIGLSLGSDTPEGEMPVPLPPPHINVPVFAAPFMKIIDRIEKGESVGFIRLYARGSTSVYHNSIDPVTGLPNEPDQPAPPPPPPPPPPIPPAIVSTLLGNYYPDETEPNYRRISISPSARFVRMKYRKRQLKISSMGDPLHLKNKLAVTTAMRAIAALDKGDIQAAAGFELKAGEYLEEEQRSRNPSETFSFQYDTATSWADPRQGIR